MDTTHGRKAETWGTIGERLHALLGEDRPTWVRAQTITLFRRALDALAADALAACAEHGVEAAWRALGVGRTTLYRARREGWLALGKNAPSDDDS